MSERRIRLGMVGGGPDAFIGAVHRIASRIDNNFELVSGCFSATPKKSKITAKELGIPNDRVYNNFEEMAEREAKLKDGAEAVAIVTPNHVHYPPAKEFLKNKIHVICDKPMTATLSDAKKLAKLAKTARKSKTLFVLTHNYTGYPLVRHARRIVNDGKLGTIRVVHAEYPQDWLSEPLEKTGQKQAGWRTDPKQAGAGGAIGDIGTHAYNLVRFVTGLKLQRLSADLDSFVKGRALDDNAHVMLQFKGGAKGIIWASQVAPGNENALKIRVYGSKGAIEWEQENPNQLWYTTLGKPRQLITRNGPETAKDATRVSRIPPGHPEGYLEGFANIYNEAAIAIRNLNRNKKIPKDVVFPDAEDGLEGVAFVDACVRSSDNNSAWVKLNI